MTPELVSDPDVVRDYEQTRKRHVEHMLARVPEHLDRLGWSAERLRAERAARLRELLGIAKERSAWHRGRLRDVNPQTIDEDGLRELPVMTKDELMAQFDQIATDPRVTRERVEQHIASLTTDAYLLNELHAVASSGSSGARGVFVWGWEAWATVQLAGLRGQLRDCMDDPELGAGPLVRMVVTAENATHFSSAQPQTFASETVQVHRFPIGLPLGEIVEGLNRVNGDSLATYPSMLATLVAEAKTGRLNIEPRRILAMAEPLLPEIRRGAQETWGAPVANLWGTSEGGLHALGCFQSDGMHLCDDLLIIEPVDADGAPVPPGVSSQKVYLTNLFNPLLPLIRYEITDEVTLLEAPCTCGSAHRRIADVQGRRDEEFHYAGRVVIHPHVFRSALARESAVTEYQVRQTAAGAQLLLQSSESFDAQSLERQLAAKLARLGCSRPTITTTLVEQIPRLSTGKLKRFVPLRPKPAP